MEEAGAKGMVLFNRFCQPDIDIEKLEVTRKLQLSDSGGWRSSPAESGSPRL
jgi:dihydroorotate dehydrogenase (fumarate)